MSGALSTLSELRVVISGESLRPPITGIGRYTQELATALYRDWGLRHLRVLDGRRLCAVEDLPHSHPTQAASGVLTVRRWLRAIPGSYALYRQIGNLYFARSTREMSLYHEPAYILRPFHGACVVTVHDLSFLTHPELHPRERVRFLEKHLPDSLARAQRILTDSEFTRQEVMRYFSLPAYKLKVTPLAASSAFRPLPEQIYAIALRRLGLQPKGYLLSLATLEPRKNLEGILLAYARLPWTLKRAYPLAVAGATGWRHSRIRTLLESMAAKGDVIPLGYVAETDLPALVAGCRGLVYPSLYEGFGLPVLEAQACGVPVVTSLRSSLPEVAGPATMLIDPEDTNALTEAIRRLCEDSELAALALHAGPLFASRFSWRGTARLTLEAYAEALGHPSSCQAEIA